MTPDQRDEYEAAWWNYLGNNDDLIARLSEDICELGPGDHGHTTCWLMSVVIGRLL